jgi:hypothetical protein
VASNVLRSLRPGGAFLLDMIGRETLARDWRERWWIEAEGKLITEERTVRPGWQHIDAHWTVIDPSTNEQHDYRATQRLYTATELRTLLLDAGFTSVDLHGNLRGAPYDDQAKRLVAIARKAE